MARESARRSSCANNLKQIGLAIHQHETAHGFLPTGGWGATWTGDPDAGFGEKQPGGWIYNILPYLEQGALRVGGRGQTKAKKRSAASRLLATPLAVLHCPSRRPAEPYPFTGTVPMENADPSAMVAKTDYAVNPLISGKRRGQAHFSDSRFGELRTPVGRKMSQTSIRERLPESYVV